MAVRARLAPVQPERTEWDWHRVKSISLPVSAVFSGDRRLEAEAYLLSGYGLRAAIEARPGGWKPLGGFASVWQPNRLTGIQVSREHGTPFLAATQIFDGRPTPRKWLALSRTKKAESLFVRTGQILVTRSGTVGRVIIAHAPHLDTLVSDDLLRVEPVEPRYWGWVYACLRTPTMRAMMTSAKYGHIIKHLEVSHLSALPVPNPSDHLAARAAFSAHSVLELRDAAFRLSAEAEARFSEAVGGVTSDASECGFEIGAHSLLGKRRRLDAAYYSPRARAILRHFQAQGLGTELLGEVTERVWWEARFARVFGEEGAPYMSADELFSVNPTITKHVMTQQAKEPERFFVKAGWILMACSGQVYGLLGSAALMTEVHEDVFFSHDLIRIAPRLDRIRPGYLLTALGHPQLGRPLVLRYAYGTSIPHLDPNDVATLPVVRLSCEDEGYIADRAEDAARLRARADVLENELADMAEEALARFIGGGRIS